MNQQATILYHPCFDQPKVANPVLRGRKKGCLSFQAAYRKRAAGRPNNACALMKPAMTTQEAANNLIAKMTSDVLFLLSRIEAAAEIVEMERRAAK